MYSSCNKHKNIFHLFSILPPLLFYIYGPHHPSYDVSKLCNLIFELSFFLLISYLEILLFCDTKKFQVEKVSIVRDNCWEVGELEIYSILIFNPTNEKRHHFLCIFFTQYQYNLFNDFFKNSTI